VGGDALRGETPIKDRRAMLEAWRKARRGGEDTEPKKRTRADPPLPPTNSRKIQRTHASNSQDSEDQQISLSQNSSASYSINYYDDETENSRAGNSILSSKTPRGRRVKLGSARRKSLMGRNIEGKPLKT
jgi:hypothetical protein